MSFCYECFNKMESEFEICPQCGAVINELPIEPIHITPGTMLADRYIIGHAVGSGGFGIIYKAYDTKLETIVAVKEFFAHSFMTRAAGTSTVIVNKKDVQSFEYRKARFLAEARNMAKFGDHRSIPNVFEFFEENGTAYIVMELLIGESLNVLLTENNGYINRDFAIHIINEVGKALNSLHEKGIIHRDVAPDNIFICSDKDLRVKLLDLGAAKLSNDDDTVIDIILKPGFSPTEQYDRTGAIGTWTDVYALGATLYVLLTGIKPDESTNRRIEDTLVPPRDIDETISENLSNSVMKAMALDRHMRFKSVNDFLKAINGNKKVTTLLKEKKRRKRTQISGIAVAIVLLITGGLYLNNTYKQMELNEYLEPTSISVWYEAEAGSEEDVAMQQIVKDFTSKFTNVTIDLSCYEGNEYLEKVDEAAKQGKLPNLFESTELDSDVLKDTILLDNILESEQALSCNLLVENYSDYYQVHNKMPLAIEVPVAIIITGGDVSVDYADNIFADVSNFGTDLVAIDSGEIQFTSSNSLSGSYDERSFEEENISCPVFITSSMKMHQYEERIVAYQWHYAYKTNSVCKFIYEWSIGKGDDKQDRAAERLLEWMLGNSYQNSLMISLAQNGEIPLSAKCYEDFANKSSDYDGLTAVLSDISFKND